MSIEDSNSIKEIGLTNYRFDIAQFLQRGWQLFVQNLWGFLGFGFISWIMIFALSQLPVAGPILLSGFAGVLQAGYFFVSFSIARGYKYVFADFFKGFRSNYFLPLFLAHFIVSLFTGVLSLVSLSCFSVVIYNPLRKLLISSPEFANLPNISIPPGSIPIFFILGLLALGLTSYLAVAYSFVNPLIVDRKMGSWDAIETSRRLITKRWWAFAVFTFVLFLINLLGFLTVVGIFFMAPFTACAMAAAYEGTIGLSQNDIENKYF